jgi:hypothetical protein
MPHFRFSIASPGPDFIVRLRDELLAAYAQSK